MQSEVMDCFTTFAMTATFTMTGLFMERSVSDAAIQNPWIATSFVLAMTA